VNVRTYTYRWTDGQTDIETSIIRSTRMSQPKKVKSNAENAQLANEAFERSAPTFVARRWQVGLRSRSPGSVCDTE